MQVVNDCWGIYRSAALIKAIAVVLSSEQALRKSYHISLDPEILVSIWKQLGLVEWFVLTPKLLAPFIKTLLWKWCVITGSFLNSFTCCFIWNNFLNILILEILYSETTGICSWSWCIITSCLSSPLILLSILHVWLSWLLATSLVVLLFPCVTWIGSSAFILGHAATHFPILCFSLNKFYK